MRRAVLTEPQVAASERLRRWWHWLGLAWLLLLIGLGVQQWQLWSTQSRIDTDILALLPQDAHDRLLSDVTRRIADGSARQVVVLLGSADSEATKRAQDAFAGSMANGADSGLLQPSGSIEGWFEQARDFYAPWRDRLLTAEQRQQLQQADPALLGEQALASLYGPMGAPRLTEWRQDPLSLWPQWWQQQARASGLQLGEDGLLEAEGRHWAVLQFETRDSAFQLDGERHLDALLTRAGSAARGAAPDLEILHAGVPLHAEAAASQANREINTIGWGSLAAVLLLVWLAFRSLRPILLVAASLLIGCGVALAVTVLVFGKVHVLTLVFGASLVGVAEDYGIHWFASRQAEPAERRWRLLRHLLPGLCLALLTSALAYVALGLAPFPGLRQMAVFSVVGLAAAFATVIFWFPYLDGGQIAPTRFSQWLGNTLERWPRLHSGRQILVLTIAVVLLSGIGIARLQTDDDLRSLQSSPPQLMAEQIRLSQLLGMPSPAQFYLVQGADATQLLQREEALTARLRELADSGKIGGYRAISDWLPSPARQQADAALTGAAEPQVLAMVSKAVGEPLARPTFSSGPLTAEAFLASPASQPFRHLWVGQLGEQVASVVMVDDLSRADALTTLGDAAKGLDGVRWVDRTADFSRLLGHYRKLMGGMLLVGIALVFGALLLRYKRNAWRVFAPTLLAGVLTLGLLGLFGQPLQLFNMLALMLLLGMGIDYGIFLVEHRGDASAWLAVCVGAASTWLSFGLLGLSATPALRAFGLTLLFGIGLVWLISPLFRPLPHAAAED
ncbi:MMPL family transporter [Stenotrophomonas sp. PS02298]|uniref:MMPL family transporter n=1 Tax=Stenotrophomonas sp. PS02298 TaxID=2991424 RepID=UPI00249C53D1|nr:MMPL family transporter [Stenotrophomonas sp. PS02298]